jgi:hypothetical protein
VTNDEKVIKEIIARYGETINLKKTPHVIVEIIQQFAPRLSGGIKAECAPPGGPPRTLDAGELVKELNARMADVNKVAASLQKAIAPAAAKKAAAR